MDSGRFVLEFLAHPGVMYQLQKYDESELWVSVKEPTSVRQKSEVILWNLPEEVVSESIDTVEGLYRVYGTRKVDRVIVW